MPQLFIDFKKAYNSVTREVLYNNLVETSKANKNVLEWNLHQSQGRPTFVWYVFYSEWFEKRCFIAIAFQISLDYDIKRVQLNLEGLKLNDMYQLLLMLKKFLYWAEAYTPEKKTRKLQ